MIVPIGMGILLMGLPLANTCHSRAECAAVVQHNINSYGKSFPAYPTRWKACRREEIASNLATSQGRNHSEIAKVFLAGCSKGAWSADDADGYFNLTWIPKDGLICERMTRFGPAWKPCAAREVAVHRMSDTPKRYCSTAGRSESRHSSTGDGGKTVCEASTLLSSPSCTVISVGINANTEFEEALHKAHPHCTIVGFDGTLNAAKRERASKRVPFLKLHEQNFGPALAANFTASTVNLLKIDCDGCEFKALPEWIERVCTEQIVVEVHRTLRWSAHRRVMMIHELMVKLSALYQIYYLEPNPVYPWLNTEYSLKRREQCRSSGR